MNVAPAEAFFGLLRVMVVTFLRRVSALVCEVCVHLRRTPVGPGYKGCPGGQSSATPKHSSPPPGIHTLGPGTRKVERYAEIHFGVVDAGAGPTPILTSRDELRMNHAHLLQTNMSTWQMWHPWQADRL